MKNNFFTAIITKDEDGFLIANVPTLPGCHTQARTYDELMERIKEAVSLYLDVNKKVKISDEEFLGVQKIEVNI